MASKVPETPWMKVRDFVTTHHDTYPFIAPATTNLSGKCVLITGASKGVGNATAISFAKAGCSKIAIAARSSLVEVEQEVKRAAVDAGHAEPDVLALQLDVCSEESVKVAADALSKSSFSGVLDILINNAGYLEEWRPVAESDPTDWWRSWEVNMKGMFLCCHFFLPMVLRSATRTIINLSSAGAHNTSYGASAYQTARFAACRFTEFLMGDHGESGLVAIAVHPGGVKTELALNMPESMHAFLVDSPELSADTMVWLARERREWLAGRFVSCNWDVAELEARKEEIVERGLLKFRMLV